LIPTNFSFEKNQTMKLSEYANYDALGLAELVRNKDVSPIELAECALDAISVVNPTINAVVGKVPDWPKAWERNPKDGPFYGVPFLVKDIGLQVEGLPCEMGSRLLEGAPPAPQDSHLMTRFRAAGLNTLGRTNIPEMAFNVTTEPVMYGPTRNPWNLDLSAGGSSGGAGAAVSAGIVPMAHATDGGGSIRIPAAHCGLVGLKPTRGRTPVGPELAAPLHGLGVQFALTRSVRDTAALLDAVQGAGSGDPFAIAPPSAPYRTALGRPPRRLRIAFSSDGGRHARVDAECSKAVQSTARLCESLGHVVEEARPEYDEAMFHASNKILWNSSLASGCLALAALLGREPSPANLETCIWKCFQEGTGYTALDLERALFLMNSVCRQVAPFFTRYDLLLTPVMAAPPQLLGTLNSDDAKLDADAFYHSIFSHAPFTALYNMTGQPAISLPLATTASGLPLGMQFVASMGDEATLLQLAAQLEAAVPWARSRPSFHVSTMAA